MIMIVFNDEVFIEFVDVLSNNTSLYIFMFDDWGTINDDDDDDDDDDEVTDQIWTALSRILCDKKTIESIYYSNHTLNNIGSIDISKTVHHSDIKSLLCLNENQDKTAVIRQKILTHYFPSKSSLVCPRHLCLVQLNGLAKTLLGSH
jgi:hypothetical protein